MKQFKDGSMLFTKKEAIEEQKLWHENDDQKNFDFSDHEEWVITSDGIILSYQEYKENK